MKSIPEISVVICTYNRSQILKGAIESLLKQTSNIFDYEIIIVDNASTDDTSKVVNKYINDFEKFNIKYIVEPKQGLSHARNAGFKNATADFVAYIDDDAKVKCDFIEKAVGYIQNGYNVFGGKYLAYYEEEKPNWYKESYGTCSYGDMHKILKHRTYLNGTNMVFKKQLLHDIGGFDPDIGMNGANINYGEETQVQIKLQNLGYDIHYVPNLVVYHLVPKYKMNVKWFITSSFKNGQSGCITFNVSPSLVRCGVQCGVHFLFNIAKFPICMCYMFFCRKHWKTIIVDCFSPLSYSIGLLYGFAKLKWRT